LDAVHARVEGKGTSGQRQKEKVEVQCDRQNWYASLGVSRGPISKNLELFIQMFQLFLEGIDFSFHLRQAAEERHLAFVLLQRAHGHSQ
jgi:hypothetical protein